MPFQKSGSGSGTSVPSVRRLLGPLMIGALLLLAPGRAAQAESQPAAVGARAQVDAVGARHTSGRKARRAAGRASKEGASNFLFRTPGNVVSNQQGKVVVLAFKNDDGYVASQVAQLLDARGLEVLTTVRAVDTAEQYRDVATSMGLAAFIDGEIKGTEERMRVIVRLRNGYSGRKVAEVTFTDTHAKMPGQLSSKLWAKLGGTVARACSDARKPRKKSRNLLQINAGTAIDTIPSSNSKLAQRGE